MDPRASDRIDAPQVVTLPQPATRIERFAAQRGIVLVKGYTEIGDVFGEEGSSVKVTAVRYADAGSDSTQHGVALHVSGVAERTVLAYLDEDELDSVITALGTLGKLRGDATSMSDFDASYHTRGQIELGNQNVNGGRVIRIRGVEIVPPAGQLLWGTAYFRLARLPELQQLLTNAKQALERAKAAR